MPHLDRQLVVDLARALGVEHLSRVRSITLRISSGELVTLEVESFLDSSAVTKVQQLRLRAEPCAPATLAGQEGLPS
jgi:hypothetical protein